MKGLCPDCGHAGVERPLMASGLCPHHHEIARYARRRDTFDGWNDVVLAADAIEHMLPVDTPGAPVGEAELWVELVPRYFRLRLNARAMAALDRPRRVSLALGADGLLRVGRAPDTAGSGYTVTAVGAGGNVSCGRFLSAHGLREQERIAAVVAGGTLVAAL